MIVSLNLLLLPSRERSFLTEQQCWYVYLDDFTFLKTSPQYRAWPNFSMAHWMSYITTTIGDARTFVAFGMFEGNSHASMPNTSGRWPELMREGINLSRSFAVNGPATTCNLTICSLAWRFSMGSSISCSCSSWRLWEKDLSTLLCIKELLWSFSMVHNGEQDSSSHPLLQTGRALAVTSMPVCKRAECKGTVDTHVPLGDWRAIQQVIAGQDYSLTSSFCLSSCSSVFFFSLLLRLSRMATEEKKCHSFHFVNLFIIFISLLSNV